MYFYMHKLLTVNSKICVLYNLSVACLRQPHSILYVFSLSFQSNWNEITDSFDEMNLREALLRGIYAYGFEKPSAIQQRAIMPCIKGKQALSTTSPFSG